MSAIAEPPSSIHAPVPDSAVGQIASRAMIDASTRLPVLLFFGAALFWLLAGSLFGFVASWKLHSPLFLADWSWLTFGRIRSAHLNAMAYGWASQAAIGVGIWLMARLCRAPLKSAPVLMIATGLWNLGVAIGISGILAGDSQSIEWLEFPAYATPLLFLAYGLIAIWAVIMFASRQVGHVYVSQWYLLAAFFWFPWLYGTANILIQGIGVNGVALGAVNWWFGHNVLGLWFTPIGLAAAYYFIPKVIGRPVHSYYLSALGFWSLALFYSWNGMHHLIGGPFPVWLVTASIVASIMMTIPVVTTAINHHMTMRGHFHMLGLSPTLRFVVFGAMSYTVVSLQGVSMAFRSWNKLTHFTHYTVAHAHLGLYAFFTMIMFGSMYYIVPRLTQCEWRSPRLIKLHFWLSAYGIIAMFGVLSIAGLAQGAWLNDPQIEFIKTVQVTIPYLMARSLSGVALTGAHFIFAIHFGLMLLRLGRTGPEPTYFENKRHDGGAVEGGQ